MNTAVDTIVAYDAATVHAMMMSVAQAMIDQVDTLTDADRVIGDGDHGIGMRRGFEAVLETLKTRQDDSVEGVFKTVGSALLSNTGGAAGAVFGTWFRSGSKALAGVDALDAESLGRFLDVGLEAVLKRGGAALGHKTMMDAVAPAAEAARAQTGKDFSDGIAAAVDGAVKGVESTRDMVAMTGKARSLGERSLGHIDPGALSVSLILKAMRDFDARS